MLQQRGYDVKVILLGDSAVGKSKLVERFMIDDYNPTQLSTFALNTFRKNATVDGKSVDVGKMVSTSYSSTSSSNLLALKSFYR
jgi:GTPase SAR1 family protein